MKAMRKQAQKQNRLRTGPRTYWLITHLFFLFALKIMAMTQQQNQRGRRKISSAKNNKRKSSKRRSAPQPPTKATGPKHQTFIRTSVKIRPIQVRNKEKQKDRVWKMIRNAFSSKFYLMPSLYLSNGSIISLINVLYFHIQHTNGGFRDRFQAIDHPTSLN